MNSLFYIKNLKTSDKYFKINCPKERYMDNLSEDITLVQNMNSDIPCYSQIYSNKLYTFDLTEPNVSCNPPFLPSSTYTSRFYKFELKTDTRMYITKQAHGSAYGLRLY